MKKNKDYENLFKTVYDLEVINKQAKANPEEFVKMAEGVYERQIKDVTSQIIFGNYKIILVTGPSSAGKTPTSKRIIEDLKAKGYNCHLISTDDFFINRDDTPTLPNGQKDYENVTTVDIPCFKQFLTDLFEKGTAQLPQFDFVTGTRVCYIPLTLKKKDLVLIEGLHAHNPLLLDGLKEDNFYKLYVTLNSDFIVGEKIVIKCRRLRLMRRMIRDYYVRGQSIEATLKQWKEVLKGEVKFVQPYKTNADYVIDTTHLYEPLVYDNYLLPIISSVPKSEEIDKIIEAFNYTGKLSKKYIPENSLLWEFVQKEL